MRSLDSVTFDLPGLVLQGDLDGVRNWSTAQGDSISLNDFRIATDIEGDIRSTTSVRNFYRTGVVTSGAAIIEVDTPEIDRCLAIRVIIKVPQQPHGITYLGSVTLPFRDFSYVLKIQ